MADPFDPLQQQTRDLAIFLGGSSKKHNYLRKYFEKVKFMKLLMSSTFDGIQLQRMNPQQT